MDIATPGIERNQSATELTTRRLSRLTLKGRVLCLQGASGVDRVDLWERRHKRGERQKSSHHTCRSGAEEASSISERQSRGEQKKAHPDRSWKGTR